MIYNSGLFTKVCYMLKNDDIEIKKEAVWAISNCTTCEDTQLVDELAK